MEADNNIEFQNLLNSYKSNPNKPLKTLLYMYKGNWGRLIVSVIFFIIKNSPVWILPIVTANIINIVSYPSKHSISELWINIIVSVVAIVQNIPTQMLHMKYLSESVRDVEANLRSNLVRKLQILSIAHHKELKSGMLQSKILRDVESIQTLSVQIYTNILPVIFNIVVALIITSSKSWKMTIVFIATIPVSGVITTLFGKSIKRSNMEFRKEVEDMSANVAQMVEMVPITRAHALEDVEIKKIDKKFQKVKNKGYTLDMITSLLGASGWVIFQLLQVGFLGITGFFAYKGKMTIGDVVLYQGYFVSILYQISNVINVYPMLARGVESINSVGEIMMIDDIERNRGKKNLGNIQGCFSFKNIEFRYNRNDDAVLQNFNLEVKKGETIAFVGESGAGKTTILNLIIGFYTPTGGKIMLDGIDMNKIDLRGYREQIAVVPQSTILFSGTIRDNITYGLSSVSEEKIKQVIKYASLEDIIEKLPQGIDTVIEEHGGNMSGGQKQRIAIARAIIRDPKIIILDEATSALDNVSEFMVQKAIDNLAKERTTFIVAHRLSTIKNADHIVVLKEGRCAEYGTYDELIKRKGEFYKSLSLSKNI